MISFREHQIDKWAAESCRPKVKAPPTNMILAPIILSRVIATIMRKQCQEVAPDRIMSLQMVIGNRRWCNTNDWKIHQMQPYNSNAKQKHLDRLVQPKPQSLQFQFIIMALQIAQEMVGVRCSPIQWRAVPTNETVFFSSFFLRLRLAALVSSLGHWFQKVWLFHRKSMTMSNYRTKQRKITMHTAMQKNQMKWFAAKPRHQITCQSL